MGTRKKIFSPGRIILYSILLAIALGTILLHLPISQAKSVKLIDCFFTATSSICVVGSLSVPLSSFSLFGKIIILILIQIGGIGLVTLSIFLISLFRNLGLATKLMVGQILELESWTQARKILIFIASFTFIIETIGALSIFSVIKNKYPFYKAIFYSIFHSVSSFCSAGLNIFEANKLAFQNNLPMLGITASLILFGTLGFITWYELAYYIKNKLSNKRTSFSLTTKVVGVTTLSLIFITTFLLIILEGPRQFKNASWITTLYNMLFNAISFRSTGFSTININSTQPATVLLILLYSLIGSSPGSTGSGIKVTTFAIFLATIKSVITGRTMIEVKGRKIPQEQVFKAMTIVSLSFCWIMMVTFFLLISETGANFSDIFLETFSSFTTLGIIGKNLIPYLSNVGKALIAITMVVGRLGSLTLLLALRTRKEKAGFQYPEERIMIS